MLKHIGRIAKTKKRVIVAYRTLPGDPTSCVCITTETLETADHDFVMQLVESNSGQTANEFAEVMARSTLSDGSNMLARLHTTGKMVKVPTAEVEMTPDLKTTIRLDELNEVIAKQKGVSVEDLAIKSSSSERPVTVVEPTQEEPPSLVNETTGVLSDEMIASNYRSQADAMFKEAKRLREEAEKLVPTKKKTKESA